MNDYDYIINSLQNESITEWEELALIVDDFPGGVDWWLGRRWIINAIDLSPLSAIEWMLTKGINLRFRDGEGYTPLHSAVERRFDDRVQVISALVGAGANVDEIGRETTTPLLFALEMKRNECALALLQLGANVHVQTLIDWYESPLEYAQRTKHELLPQLENAAARKTREFGAKVKTA